MAAFSAIMRGMNILLSIAITTGILSGIWGWVAVSLVTKLGASGLYGLLCLPQGGLKGWRSPLQLCLVAWCGDGHYLR
ncbi:inner membrane protein YcdZ [Escherichia coli]|nr:inner membrane protein YcdZ [Escherichia coli]